MWEALAAIVLAVAASVVAVTTIAKRMSNAVATQNRLAMETVAAQQKISMEQGKQLVNAALKNMDANTEAIKANSAATAALAATLRESIVVRDERDRTIFKQLDRIEGKIR